MGITIFWSEWDGKAAPHDLLRRAVGEFLHCRPEALVFGQGEHGRPELAGREDVDFSISHSEKLWACAVGSCRVGLDLQKEYEKNGEKLAGGFFIRRRLPGWRSMALGISAVSGHTKRVM